MYVYLIFVYKETINKLHFGIDLQACVFFDLIIYTLTFIATVST